MAILITRHFSRQGTRSGDIEAWVRAPRKCYSQVEYLFMCSSTRVPVRLLWEWFRGKGREDAEGRFSVFVTTITLPHAKVMGVE